VVLVLGLVRQPGRGQHPAQVLRLHQPRARVHLPDRPHGEPDGVDLVDQHAQERAVVARVRVPVAVEPAEPGGGQRLVDRRVELQPGIALGHARGEGRDLRREVGPAEVGVARTAAVVQQPGDRGHAQVAQPAEPLVRPAPVGPVEAVGGDPLPEHGVADRADAQRRELVEVARAVLVAAEDRLVDVAVPDPGHGALETAPDLERRHRRDAWALRHNCSPIRARGTAERGFPMFSTKSIYSTSP
jgi:hypothetical protein